MNTMTAAMVQAGVKLPLIQRVWMAIRDSPGLPSKRYAAILKTEARDVSSAISDLKHRQMLLIEKVDMRVTLGKGSTVKPVETYRVLPTMKEYELLPRKTSPQSRQSVKQLVQQIAAAQSAAQCPPGPLPVTGLDVVADPINPMLVRPVQSGQEPSWLRAVAVAPTNAEIDAWSLADARRVYTYLAEIFNP